MKKRILPIFLALSLSVCMTVGFVPSASAQSSTGVDSVSLLDFGSPFYVDMLSSMRVGSSSTYSSVNDNRYLFPDSSGVVTYVGPSVSTGGSSQSRDLFFYSASTSAPYSLCDITYETPIFRDSRKTYRLYGPVYFSSFLLFNEEYSEPINFGNVSSSYGDRLSLEVTVQGSSGSASFSPSHTGSQFSEFFLDFVIPSSVGDVQRIVFSFSYSRARSIIFTSASTSVTGSLTGYMTFSFGGLSLVSTPDNFYFINQTLGTSNSLLTAIRNALTSTNGTNPLLTNILSSVNAIKDSVSGGSQSPMDKFESDYIQNFQGQLDKTESYIGSNSPVLPNNFVSSSGGGSSFVDSVKDNIGLSSDSLDMSDFAQASGSFSGSASTGDGGMWQFFTQDVADSMTTGSASTISLDDALPSDFEDELMRWLQDSERWLGEWSSP